LNSAVEKNPIARGAVLVTGASSGIGKAIALNLRNRGYRVFASVRSRAARNELEQAGCEPVELDVTDPRSLTAAREHLLTTLGRERLAGVINNAGILAAGPWEQIELDEVRRILEVNFVGAVAVTQTFLPRLRADRGRLLFIGSVAGRIAPPFVGAYAASKFAVRALADSLRREVAALGVPVVLVEAGSIRTGMRDKVRFERDVDEAYRMPFASFQRHFREGRQAGLAPEQVANAIAGIMDDVAPPAQLLVSERPSLLYRIYLGLPVRWVDALISWRMGRAILGSDHD